MATWTWATASYAFALTLPSLRTWSLALEEILIEQERLYRSGRWPWHPDDGGPQELTSLEYEFVDVGTRDATERGFAIWRISVTGERTHSFHAPVLDAWPFEHTPALPHLHLALSPIKALSHFWTHILPILPQLEALLEAQRRAGETLNATAVHLVEVARATDYALRLVETETPSQWREFRDQRPAHYPPQPELRRARWSTARRTYVSLVPELAAPSTFISPQPHAASLSLTSQQEQGHMNLPSQAAGDDAASSALSQPDSHFEITSVGSPSRQLRTADPTRELAKHARAEEWHQPAYLTSLDSKKFGLVPIFPNQTLCQKLWESLEERLNRAAEETQNMSWSQALHDLRGRDGKEQQQQLLWEHDVRAWREEQGFDEDLEF